MSPCIFLQAVTKSIFLCNHITDTTNTMHKTDTTNTNTNTIDTIDNMLGTTDGLSRHVDC